MMTVRTVCRATCLFASLLLSVAHGQQPATTSAPAGSPPPGESSNASFNDTLRDAYKLTGQGKQDDALAKVNTAIQLNPKSLAAYVLRGSIYSDKKVYDKAEQDFNAALQLDPNNSTVKFNLAEIKFAQKQYPAARPGFAALVKDKDDNLGDLAAYKVFLCDLLGGQVSDARKELDAFNQAGSRPSYYFGNAAWDLVNHKPDDSKSWLASAARIYSIQKGSLYASSLISLGYLPFPSPTPTP